MDTYRLPELRYDFAALEPRLSAKILELHHDTHHAGYVKKANTTLEQLAELRETDDFDRITMLEKNLAFALSGHVLHSIYWTNLSPDGGGRPMGDLSAAIDDSFGSFERFRSQMTAATTNIQGSGWGALMWEPQARRLLVEQLYDHQGNVTQASQPVLVFDAWEHAFYLDYHNDKETYTEAVWELVDWSDVAVRFDAARTIVLEAA